MWIAKKIWAFLSKEVNGSMTPENGEVVNRTDHSHNDVDSFRENCEACSKRKRRAVLRWERHSYDHLENANGRYKLYDKDCEYCQADTCPSAESARTAASLTLVELANKEAGAQREKKLSRKERKALKRAEAEKAAAERRKKEEEERAPIAGSSSSARHPSWEEVETALLVIKEIEDGLFIKPAIETVSAWLAWRCGEANEKSGFQRNGQPREAPPCPNGSKCSKPSRHWQSCSIREPVKPTRSEFSLCECGHLHASGMDNVLVNTCIVMHCACTKFQKRVPSLPAVDTTSIPATLAVPPAEDAINNYDLCACGHFRGRHFGEPLGGRDNGFCDGTGCSCAQFKTRYNKPKDEMAGPLYVTDRSDGLVDFNSAEITDIDKNGKPCVGKIKGWDEGRIGMFKFVCAGDPLRREEHVFISKVTFDNDFKPFCPSCNGIPRSYSATRIDK